jgi:cysteinyl-tRNA synthetase
MGDDMALRIYNSLSREKEEFTPIHSGEARVYVCGPTVYDDAHLGHGKTYVNFDVMVRYLRYLDYRVRYVQNITDVGHMLDTGEDRILKGARRENVHPMELAEMYTRRYFRDMDRLNVTRPDISPRATGHVLEMIEQIKALIARGHAYEVNGSVYYSVAHDPDYGKLSGRRPDESLSGTRVEARGEKRDPADFALWKRAEPEHVMRWPSPWGEGFPGWHIECSVMSTKYLGQPFDIHGGGVENKFPHHECEIAQAESATGLPFAHYWVHNGMLMIRGEEMHKSLGNFVTLEQAFTQWSPMAIRFFLLLSHYRGPIDFTLEAVQAAGKGLDRLLSAVRAVRNRMAGAPEGEVSSRVRDLVDGATKAFGDAMDDDFGTPGAVAALFDMTRQANAFLAEGGAPLTQADLALLDGTYTRLAGDVLGVLPDSLDEQADAGLVGALVEVLIETRAALRAQKQWALADQIRDRIEAVGVQLKDGPTGTTWSLS